MKTLTETADLILSAASRLEKLAEDPNIAPRTAIRGIYKRFKPILKKHFNDYLVGEGLSDNEYAAVLAGTTDVAATVQASKLKAGGYKVTIVIVAKPAASKKKITKPAHLSGALKIGKYLQEKEGVNMSNAASLAASEYASDETSSFSMTHDIMFTVQKKK
jgi:hypothetical protein